MAKVDYPSFANPGIFLIIVGPSGSGKSTVMNLLLENRPDFTHSLSYTTRAPRGEEKNGVDYNFISVEEFEKKIEEGEWLEYANVYGKNYYGTSRTDVLARMKDGRSCLKDIDVQGAEKIRKTFPEAVQVFLASPSTAETERRLRSRGTDSEEAIQKRLADAAMELQHWREFDYVVICDKLPVVIEQLNAIITAEKLKPQRIPKTAK